MEAKLELEAARGRPGQDCLDLEKADEEAEADAADCRGETVDAELIAEPKIECRECAAEILGALASQSKHPQS